jgi:predicted RNA-binding Zn ribbon-like protein
LVYKGAMSEITDLAHTFGQPPPPHPAPRWVCIDFANTVEWRLSPNPTDRLTGYDRLLAWAERVNLVEPEVAESLRREAMLRPEEAQQAFAEAIELREAIYRVMYGVANGMPRDPGGVALLYRGVADALRHRALVDAPDGFVWEWPDEETDLDAVTHKVALSASDLLTSPEVHNLKACPGDGCGWLFVDTSRAGNRRWCDMELCGNRAKVRRHREAVRQINA